MSELFFEDLDPGFVVDCGSRTITKEEIVAFAEEYDPLSFHVDEAAAERTVHDGLIASGWHTVALAHRLGVDAFRKDVAVIAGVQVDDVTWPRPVRPGDTLSVQITIREMRPSESNPDVGVSIQDVVATNQRNDVVLSYVEKMLIERRT